MTARKVLVVDDDDEVREITSLALELMAGWQVESVGSGAAALAALQVRRPDVVLLDVMMPEMDGPTVFSRMQMDPRLSDIPVILFTAKVQVGHVQVWDSLPVAGVIAKPFSVAAIPGEIERLLELHATRVADGSRSENRSVG